MQFLKYTQQHLGLSAVVLTARGILLQELAATAEEMSGEAVKLQELMDYFTVAEASVDMFEGAAGNRNGLSRHHIYQQ